MYDTILNSTLRRSQNNIQRDIMNQYNQSTYPNLNTERVYRPVRQPIRPPRPPVRTPYRTIES